MVKLNSGNHQNAAHLAIKAATSLMLVMSIFWAGVPNALAHNIDLENARKKAQLYARRKRDDPTRKYLHFKTECWKLFPGHNHYVGCNLYYWTAADAKRPTWSCKEYVEVYYEAHYKPNPFADEVVDPQMYLKNTSPKQC